MYSRASPLLITLLLPAGCGFIGFEEETNAGQGSARDGGAPMDGSPEPDAELSQDAGTDADAEAVDAAVDAALDAEAPVATQVADYCQTVPALPSAPVIDGTLDGMLNLVPMAPVGWSGSTMDPGHTTASLAAAFRPNGLYVFVRVVDPNRLPPAVGANAWEGDGVELYADDDGTYSATPLYDDPGSVQIITSAPSDDTSSAASGQRFRDTVDLGLWTSRDFRAFPTFDGYVLEALLTAADLDLTEWSLRSGGHVGFNVSINVSGLDEQVGTDAGLQGNRLGQYFLRVAGEACSGRPYCSSAAFCNPLLVD